MTRSESLARLPKPASDANNRNTVEEEFTRFYNESNLQGVTMTHIEIPARLIHDAITAMFAPVAAAFPEIATGDFALEQELRLRAAVREAIEGWVRNNADSANICISWTKDEAP